MGQSWTINFDCGYYKEMFFRGIAISRIKVGDHLRLGDMVLLEITQIGKDCHDSGCGIKRAIGDCIMPKEGLFARVIRGGEVETGAPLIFLKKNKLSNY